MKTIIHCKNIDLTPSITALVNEKIDTIAKLFDPRDEELAEARVEVGRPSMHHKTGAVYSAEINLKIGGNLFRAVAEHFELRNAVDFARDELEKQIKKEKNKKRDSNRQPKRI